ncbi:MAG: UDP-N-acetylmuramoyl-tripeptide--D-alanyl-D-alanine ligase [Ignavibacteriales bacterium]|nr:UDP-N-acetylmuramoyl-tripeptide--D-alanyl-D-alanine ligase [Ignavibacteriales bacterium]
MTFTGKDILALPHVQALGFERSKGLLCDGISTDSRTVGHGKLFIALHGEKFDGHNFITKAVESGAAAIIADAKWAEANPIMVSSLNLPRLIVEDTVTAFGQLANLHRKKFKIPVVVIGGSNGKTTTKEMVSSVLRTKFRVLSTEGNLNNHIGVPQTLLRLERQHQIAVVEIGTNHFGEIAHLCSVAEPTHVLITNVGREHLEFFGTVEGVAKAEGEAFEWIRKNRRSKAVGFINQDDVRVRKQAKGLRKAITFGFNKGPAMLKGKILSFDDNARALLEMKPKGKKAFRVQVAVPGHHNAMNALAAAAVGLAFKVPAKRIAEALSSFTSASKRMQVLKLDRITVLNDTYNSNPDSALAALNVLEGVISKGKKIAVLADMLELGKNAADEHGRIGREVAKSGVRHLLTYGPLSQNTHIESTVVFKSHFAEKKPLCEHLAELISPGDVVLVKGSRGMKMEEVVAFLEERFKPTQNAPDQAA